VILPHALAYNAAHAPEAMRRIARSARSTMPRPFFELSRRQQAPVALKDIGHAGPRGLDQAAELACRTNTRKPPPAGAGGDPRAAAARVRRRAARLTNRVSSFRPQQNHNEGENMTRTRTFRASVSARRDAGHPDAGPGCGPRQDRLRVAADRPRWRRSARRQVVISMKKVFPRRLTIGRQEGRTADPAEGQPRTRTARRGDHDYP